MNFRLPSYGFDIHQMGRLGCKILKWLNYATTFSTQFILVLFTFDRLIAVTLPLKYRLLKDNLKYPLVTSLITFSLFYFLTAGNLYVFDLEDGECTQAVYISELGGKIYFHYTATLLYCAIPSALMFIFNIVIIIKMRQVHNLVRKREFELNCSEFLKRVSGQFKLDQCNFNPRLFNLCNFNRMHFQPIVISFYYHFSENYINLIITETREVVEKLIAKYRSPG